jgi:flavin reductase (DIM6/NTAB) family NADH-FMN oxidoreductase RutF
MIGVLRRAAHHLTLGVRTIPQFAVVALPTPQRQVSCALTTSSGAVDVTSQTIAVSLDPLRIGIAGDALGGDDARLVFRETVDRPEDLGRLDLQFERVVPLPDGELNVFRPRRGWDGCVGPVRKRLYYAWKRWMRRRRGDRRHTFEDFKGLLIHYIRPRPVALVTVMDGAGVRGNLFPMDLLAQPGPTTFVAALKNTNRAVEQVRRSRRMVVSWIPPSLGPQAYALADMHRADETDFGVIAFPLARSARFHHPVPAQALSVVEVDIERMVDMGSHTALIGVPVQTSHLNEGLAMHHVSGLYQEHCRRRGRAI